MSVGPDPASIDQQATEGSGRYAEGGNAGEGRSDELRAELVDLVRAPYSWSWSLPTTPHAEKIADAILAAGYRRVPTRCPSTLVYDLGFGRGKRSVQCKHQRGHDGQHAALGELGQGDCLWGSVSGGVLGV